MSLSTEPIWKQKLPLYGCPRDAQPSKCGSELYIIVLCTVSVADLGHHVMALIQSYFLSESPREIES